MKIIIKIVTTATFIALMFSTTSCIVLVPNGHHDNGKHLGRYKNLYNPYSPNDSKEKGKDNKGHNMNKSNGKNNRH